MNVRKLTPPFGNSVSKYSFKTRLELVPIKLADPPIRLAYGIANKKPVNQKYLFICL